MSSVRWGYLWQRHHAIATAAAEDGWTVDFVDPPLRGLRHAASASLARLRGRFAADVENPRHERIHVIKVPPILSIVGGYAKSRYLRTVLDAHYDVCLVYVPDPDLVELAGKVASRLIYDEVIDWRDAPPSWHAPKHHAKGELAMRGRRWERITDSVLVARRNSERGVRCALVMPAADKPFAQHRWAPPVSGGPILYFGAVDESWTDVDLLCGLAESGLAVRVFGPVMSQSVVCRMQAAGVEWLGTVPAPQLPAAIDSSSALILPYASNRQGTLVPAKLWNCLATNRSILVRGLRLPDGLEGEFVEMPQVDGQAVDSARALAEAAPAREPLVEQWGERWAAIRGTE